MSIDPKAGSARRVLITGASSGIGLAAALRLAADEAEICARTAVYLATSPEVEGMTGQYFFKGKPARSQRITDDREVAARLWAISERLTAPGRETTQEIQEVVR